MKRIAILAVAALSAVVLVTAAAAGSAAMTGKPGWFKESETTSDTIAERLINAVPYPLGSMRDSLERRNLRERLLRFNKPQKIGYLYLMSFGKFVGYYVVKGKISSVQSQMTNENQTWEASRDNDTVVTSIGDDGTWGPNEGGDAGIFFFTSGGVLVETKIDWVYSDAPLAIKVPNLLK